MNDREGILGEQAISANRDNRQVGSGTTYRAAP